MSIRERLFTLADIAYVRFQERVLYWRQKPLDYKEGRDWALGLAGLVVFAAGGKALLSWGLTKAKFYFFSRNKTLVTGYSSADMAKEAIKRLKYLGKQKASGTLSQEANKEIKQILLNLLHTFEADKRDIIAHYNELEISTLEAKTEVVQGNDPNEGKTEPDPQASPQEGGKGITEKSQESSKATLLNDRSFNRLEAFKANVGALSNTIITPSKAGDILDQASDCFYSLERMKQEVKSAYGVGKTGVFKQTGRHFIHGYNKIQATVRLFPKCNIMPEDHEGPEKVNKTSYNKL